MGNGGKAQVFQKVQTFPVGREKFPFRQLDIEHVNVQSPLGGDLRVQLPQRTGGGVPGVGKQGLPLLLLGPVQPPEAGFRHEHLSPDDEPLRGVFQYHGNSVDGPQILRHILAHVAVSTGGSPDELSVLIFQRHGKAVDFRLHGKYRIGVRSKHPVHKVRQLFLGENILQAVQGHRMGNFFKFGQCLAPHPL